MTVKPEIVGAGAQITLANHPAKAGALARVLAEKLKPGGIRHV